MIDNRIRGYVLGKFDPKNLVPFDNVLSGMVVVSKVPAQKKKSLTYKVPIWAEPFKYGMQISLCFINFDMVCDNKTKRQVLKRFAKCKIIELDEKIVTFTLDKLKELKEVTSNSFQESFRKEFQPKQIYKEWNKRNNSDESTRKI
jgi:hypothetical protein